MEVVDQRHWIGVSYGEMLAYEVFDGNTGWGCWMGMQWRVILAGDARWRC